MEQKGNPGIPGFSDWFLVRPREQNSPGEGVEKDFGSAGDRCRNHRSIRTFGIARPRRSGFFPFAGRAFCFRLVESSFSRLKLLAPTTWRYQVSHPSATRPLRSRILSISRRTRRRPVFPVLESLEARQLLAVASVGLNPIVAQPSVGAPRFFPVPPHQALLPRRSSLRRFRRISWWLLSRSARTGLW